MNILNITKINVGYVIIQHLKGTRNIHCPVSSDSSSRSFLFTRSHTALHDATSAVYQKFRFGVANEVLKYTDMSSA